MKKTCVISGGKEYQSNSINIARKIVNYFDDWIVKWINLNEANISIVTNGEKIFDVGPLKSKDKSVAKIAFFLKEADIIIWITPVYMKNVSGVFKVFLDRIAVYSHTMELAGKLGGILVLSAGSETLSIEQYLQEIQISMGIKTIFSIGLTTGDISQDEIQVQLDKINKGIKEGFFLTNGELERYFSNLQNIWLSKDTSRFRNYEKEFYINNEIEKFNSFQEYAVYNNSRSLKNEFRKEN